MLYKNYLSADREKYNADARAYYKLHQNERIKSLRAYRLSHHRERYEDNKLAYLRHHREHLDYARTYSLAHPEKIKAKSLARYHIPLENTCRVCGSSTDLQRHHFDYSKPLEVVTMCRTCHEKTHRQMKNAGSVGEEK